jgi:hypothetical protein
VLHVAAAGLQLGIVLASAAVITGMPVLAWGGGLLGLAAALSAALAYAGLA